jgi:hypothetical protein
MCGSRLAIWALWGGLPAEYTLSPINRVKVLQTAMILARIASSPFGKFRIRRT